MTVRRRQPPRLVARALIASFLTVAVILGAVFVLVSLDVSKRVRQSVVDNLDAGQQVFARVESRREQDMMATVSTLAENPTLKAALDTWQTERHAADRQVLAQLVETVQNEAGKVSARIDADVLVIADSRGEIIATAGRRASAFTPGASMKPRAANEQGTRDRVVTTSTGVFRMMEVPLELPDAVIGWLELGTALDAAYAQELATLARGESAVLLENRVLATTLPEAASADLVARTAGIGDTSAIVDLGGESFAARRINAIGPATFLALASIDAAAKDSTSAAMRGLAGIAIVALALAVVGSLWLARTLTRPIDQLSVSLAAMRETRRAGMAVPMTGSSRELDALADTFNSLIRSLEAAEAETQAAYLGAIRALAAALDARDPYTAGHSERVSTLSIEMGRAMQLPEPELATLRLGALLHDIGKIGVPDDVLRKPSALTPSEFEMIRAHPVIGARILRSIPFLTAHLPIVELHHERPDGRGYPYGLLADAIPVAARIVHVADAYDAMTSARAYRPGRPVHEAVSELERCVGTDFDRTAVEALTKALPRLPAASAGFDPMAFQWAAPRSQVS